MTINFLNIRGLNSPLKQNKVVLRANLNKVDVLCLLETRVKVDKSEAILKSKFLNWNIYMTTIMLPMVGYGCCG